MIYDCFIYNGEYDILRLRLAETSNLVNKWVVVECTHTHSGIEKTKFLTDILHFRELEPYKDRIIHRVFGPRGITTTDRERSHREEIGGVLGLLNLNDDDIIHFSDADEIPKSTVFSRYQVNHVGICSVVMDNCYYWINCVGGKWGAAKIGRWKDFKEQFGGNTHLWRFANCPLILDGGWHCSFFGNNDEIRRKLESYLHEELNLPHYKDDRHLNVCRHAAIDLFLRKEMLFSFVDYRSIVPECVRNASIIGHQNYYRNAIFHEQWYNDHQLMMVWKTYDRVAHLSGAIIEIGCWEGKSSVALCNYIFPHILICIDTWEGSKTEGESHGTVQILKERNVYEQFKTNMWELTKNNYDIERSDSIKFLSTFDCPIKFAHIDGAHDYETVREEIRLIKEKLVIGGVICGDDFATAHVRRHDLNGGVERAVRELCSDGLEVSNNLWIWQKRQ